MAQRIQAATRKGLFTIERNGDGWNVAHAAFLGDNLPIALVDPRDGATYAALDHGHFGTKLHRSMDQGRTWDDIAVPVYPELLPGEEYPKTFTGATVPNRLEKIWALEPGGPGEPGVLWCGTIPGGLFRSEDHGATWNRVDSLWRHPGRKSWAGGGADYPGIHSVCVHPENSKSVAVGVSCGGVWFTEDGGESWENRSTGIYATYMPPELKFEPNVQDVHRVVRCRTAPDCLWAQHHNGVFRTTNAGRQWHDLPDVPPSVFGFAVAVHPTHPDTAWFVPAIKDEKRIPVGGKVVVTRTRDGGKSFDVLTRGLPQSHAYDLVYRHALDIDADGNCLAFGSTTGSLWVTEDQGDTWQSVSHHLPPIYCVRFVG